MMIYQLYSQLVSTTPKHYLMVCRPPIIYHTPDKKNGNHILRLRLLGLLGNGLLVASLLNSCLTISGVGV